MPLQIYKSGQGRYVRIGTAIGVALVALALAYYLWLLLELYVPKTFAYKVYLTYVAPAALFAAIAAAAAWYLNKPTFVDFFIATESEMKKVSWSSWPELSGSTFVVIVTVLVLALFIYITDVLITGGLSSGWTLPYTNIHIRGLGLW